MADAGISRRQKEINAMNGVMTNASSTEQESEQRSMEETNDPHKPEAAKVGTDGDSMTEELHSSETAALVDKEHCLICGKSFLASLDQLAVHQQCSDCRKQDRSAREDKQEPQRVECGVTSSDIGVSMDTLTSAQKCHDNDRKDQQHATEIVQHDNSSASSVERNSSIIPGNSQVGMKHQCECGKSFRFLCRLKAHKRSHTGEKQFVCEICGAAFVRSNYLICHKRVHTGERPFVCDVCGATFTRSNNLNIHKRIHSGVKPFSCTLCSKSFGLRYDLITHMRSHSGEKPYACRVCNKTFSQGSNRKAHEQRHMGLQVFSCEICDATFAQSGQLRIHKRTHTGEKLLSCEVCEKNFVSKGSLTSHMRSHTGEALFS